MAQQKSILLIDDHNLFREGLKTIIRRDSQFTVVAEAKNADEGVMPRCTYDLTSCCSIFRCPAGAGSTWRARSEESFRRR